MRGARAHATPLTVSRPQAGAKSEQLETPALMLHMKRPSGRPTAACQAGKHLTGGAATLSSCHSTPTQYRLYSACASGGYAWRHTSVGVRAVVSERAADAVQGGRWYVSQCRPVKGPNSECTGHSSTQELPWLVRGHLWPVAAVLCVARSQTGFGQRANSYGGWGGGLAGEGPRSAHPLPVLCFGLGPGAAGRLNGPGLSMVHTGSSPPKFHQRLGLRVPRLHARVTATAGPAGGAFRACAERRAPSPRYPATGSPPPRPPKSNCASPESPA